MRSILSLFVGSVLGVAAVDVAPWSSTRAAALVPVATKHKVKTIQCEVRTEPWSGWGEGTITPDSPLPPRTPEKFERFETPAGQSPTFSGKVVGIPSGKTAHVTVIANLGTQWINPKNYKSVKVAPDGSFTVTADHKSDAEKSLAVNIDGGGVLQFLRADFAPTESAKNIEFQLAEARTVILTMEDAKGTNVRNFRVEAFNAYTVQDDAGNNLRVQRLTTGTSGNGAIVFTAPPEPIAVLISSNGLAPYYQIIDPRSAEEFHFKMLPASRLRGVVTRDGQPVANEQIYLVNRAAPLSATLRKSDPQGRFDIAGRVPGQQEIRIADFETSIQVEPGETAEVNLELTATPTTLPTAASRLTDIIRFPRRAGE